jgi:ribonuclease HI
LKLIDPLPEGSRRHNPSSSPPSQQNHPSQDDFLNTSGHITISFDGAMRGNGINNKEQHQKGSIGVFVERYSCSFSVGKELKDAYTNNQAEIAAAIQAVNTAINITNKHGPKSFTIQGDSAHVISKIMNGDLTGYVLRKGEVNSHKWVELKGSLENLQHLFSDFSFKWVPREKNREPDELANAVLDNRPPNPNILSSLSFSFDHSFIDTLILQLQTTKLSTLRTLPDSLALLWQSFMTNILAKYSTNKEEQTFTRKLFTILPHILSLPAHNIQNTSIFSRIKAHIILLNDDQYLQESIILLQEKISNFQQAERQKNPANEEKRIKTLCSRGLFHKCLPGEDIELAEPSSENIEKIRNLFPKHELPNPLDIIRAHPCTFSEVKAVFRKLKRGKSPGLSGWTRELLYPLFQQPSPIVQSIIAHLFSDFTNTNLTEVEKNFFLNGILSPLTYKSSPGKIRPIIIPDAFFKIAWSVVIGSVNDPNISNNSSHTFNRKGSAQLSLVAVQQALQENEDVICMDAENAYNTVLRKAAFQYLEKHKNYYYRCFPLINLMYCNPSKATWYHLGSAIASIDITAGTRQGCVSGMWFYTLATLELNMKHRKFITQTADDVHIIKNAIGKVTEIVEDFKSIGQNIAGKKLKIISSKPTLILPQCIKHGEIHRNATKILGGIVSPKGAKEEGEIEITNPILSKISKKYKSILSLPTSLQNKFLIFHALSLDYLYFCETFFIETRNFFFEKLESILLDTFCTLFSLHRDNQGELPSHFVFLFSPVKDGGFGCFPYAHTHDFFLQKAKARAVEYIRSFFFPDFHPTHDGATRNTPHPSLKSLWTSIHRTDFAPISHAKQQMRAGAFSTSNFFSWLTTWPTNSITTLSDEEFLFACRFRLSHLTPRPYPCPREEICLSSLSPYQYTQHIVSCIHCAAQNFHIRHEKVNNMLHKTCQYHSFHTIANPKGLPIPKHTKGGADLLALGSSSHIFALDVALAKEKKETETNERLAAIFLRKMSHYKDYQQKTGHIPIPFVMSLQGVIYSKTLSLIEPFFTSPFPNPLFRKDLISNVQFALIRGLLQGINLTHARSQQQNNNTERIPNEDHDLL